MFRFIVMCLVAVAIIGTAGYAAFQEDKQWKEFAATHKCRKVAQIRGEVYLTTGIGSNGQMITGTATTSDKTGYLCDDGVTYYR